MDAHDTSKLPWEAPAAVSLTDTDSRADISDVPVQNGFSAQI